MNANRLSYTTTNIKFKIIALDLDGTLTNNEKIITPKTKNALTRAQQDGAHIILASGRPTYGIKPIADSLELEQHGGYILSYNGGKIIDWKSKEILFANHLPDGVIPQIYKYSKEKGHALLGYIDDEIVTEMPDDTYVKEESRINKMNIRKVDYLLDNIEKHPTKLLMTGTPDDMARAEKELSQILGERMDVFRSAPFFIELVPKGIDKAQSLQKIISLLGLSAADMIAFGDGYNDISMISLAGMGVAMENAAEEVKAAANFITRSNEDDGVGYAIERLCYTAINE